MITPSTTTTAPPRYDRYLILIAGAGLAVRLLFWLVGARFYYPSAHSVWYNGDTHSFLWTWDNLWNHGTYTFDWLEPDAAFGRLPGYVYFYGLHYILFGAKHAVMATEVTQILLDALAVWMVGRIAQRLVPDSTWAPYAAAALYAVYPFTIVWTTIIGTEPLGTFLTILWAWVVLYGVGGRWHAVVAGLVIAWAFYTREYLGIMLPITGLWWLLRAHRETGQWLSWPLGLRPGIVLTVTFLALYIWWPVRNWVSFHRFVPVKTLTAGYSNYNRDLDSFRSWVDCWSNDVNQYLDPVANYGKADYPAEVFDSPGERRMAERYSKMAYACGSSFWLFRAKIYGTDRYRDTTNKLAAQHRYWTNCNDSVSAGFQRLEALWRAHHPVKYWLDVPGQNILKAFFKNGLARKSSASGAVVAVLFGYRTLLVLLGFWGMWVYRRRQGMFPVAALILFMYAFITITLRVLEMRYLLQADALLVVPAGLVVGGWLDKWLGKRPATVAVPEVAGR